MGFPGGSVVKNPPANAGDAGDVGSVPGLGRSLGVGNGNLVCLPGKFHGHRSLAGYSLWGHKESDTTKQLSTCTHTHIYTHTPLKVALEGEKNTIT